MSRNEKYVVAVVGAGVAGLVTALSLRIAGHMVTLFDRSPYPPENTSAIAGGMLAPLSESDILPSSYVLAGLRGIELWKDLLGEGHAACLHESGSLVLAGQNSIAEFEAFAAPLIQGPNAWLKLDAEAIARLEPDLAGHHTRGVFLPHEAYLTPDKAMQAIYSRFIALGGRFRLAETDPGTLIEEFDRVIDCRGYVRGLDADLHGVQGEIVTVHQPEVCLSRPVRVVGGPSPFYIVPRPGQEFAIGATAIVGADESDWRVRVTSALTLLSFAIEVLPGLNKARIVAMNSGFRAAYPSLLPEIRMRNAGRTIQINGLYRHGFLLSPVMAACVTAMLRDEPHEFMPLFTGKLNVPIIHLERDEPVGARS